MGLSRIDKLYRSTAIEYLCVSGLRSGYICAELDVSRGVCRGIRDEMVDLPSDEETGSGTGPNPTASKISNVVHAIEHSLLIGCMRAVLGDANSFPLLSRVAIFRRYQDQVTDTPFLQDYYTSNPTHQPLNINTAWQLMYEYVAGNTRYIHCHDCDTPYYCHEKQGASDKCPYCWMAKRTKRV